MKRTILMLAAVALIFVAPSCKKGENDPFLSFKTRDARITGVWTMSALESTNTNTTVTTGTTVINTSTSTFNGTTITETWTSWGGGTYTYSFSYKLTIEKDGTYMLEQVLDGDKSEETGYWSWVDDAKKKTRISIGGSVYDIDQLKNKEIILMNNGSNKDTDSDGDSDEDVYTFSATLEKE